MNRITIVFIARKRIMENLIQKFAEAVSGERRIFGIYGLCEYLQCSEPTARKLSKHFPVYRVPGSRKLFFLEKEILEGLRNAQKEA